MPLGTCMPLVNVCGCLNKRFIPRIVGGDILWDSRRTLSNFWSCEYDASFQPCLLLSSASISTCSSLKYPGLAARSYRTFTILRSVVCTEARARSTSTWARVSALRSLPFAVSASQERTLESSSLSSELHEPSSLLRRSSWILGPRSAFADRTYPWPRQ